MTDARIDRPRPQWRTWLPRVALTVGGVVAGGFVLLVLLAMR